MSAHLTLATDRGRRVERAAPDRSARTTGPGSKRSGPRSSHGRGEGNRVHAARSPGAGQSVLDVLAGSDRDDSRRRPAGAQLGRAMLRDERGAVTAEYAIVILAGVAFAGLLVAILRSNEIRQMLVDLVQQALGSAG